METAVEPSWQFDLIGALLYPHSASARMFRASWARGAALATMWWIWGVSLRKLQAGSQDPAGVLE